MSTFDLPTTFEYDGKEYPIRSDYRAVLDICIALADPDLTDEDRGETLLTIFYPDIETMPPDCYDAAIRYCFWFIRGGEEEESKEKAPRLVDWEKDFRLIVAPVNRVMGVEIRSLKYLHWWTFLAAYYEIGGDCTFAQVVAIRDKKARGKPLDKTEREWLKRNKNLVELKTRYSKTEDELINNWIKGG